MKTKIPFAQAWAALQQCAAIIVADQNRAVTYPSLARDASEIQELDGVFLSYSYEDEEGQIFEGAFTQEANPEVEVENASMWLFDEMDSSEPVEIVLLGPMPVLPPDSVIVCVNRGMVQDVKNIPLQGVEVHDYDVAPNVEADLLRDSDGERFYLRTWPHQT